MRRISTDSSDPGYVADGSVFKVLFNGYEVNGVVTADEKAGYILQTVYDQDGKMVFRNGHAVTQRRYGGVVVIEEPKRTLWNFQVGAC